jgi:hypothetical protein
VVKKPHQGNHHHAREQEGSPHPRDLIIQFVLARKAESLYIPWVDLYTEHPELLGKPRYDLPAFKCSDRPIWAEHMTFKPSTALLAKFHPVPRWTPAAPDHPLCKAMSPAALEHFHACCYEEYVRSCANWEDGARQAIRKATVGMLLEASEEIEGDESEFWQFNLVPRAVRFALPAAKKTMLTKKDMGDCEVAPMCVSESCVVRVEKWLDNVVIPVGIGEAWWR